MTQIVANCGAGWCGYGATSRYLVFGIDKPTSVFGATSATYIKKCGEYVKRTIEEGRNGISRTSRTVTRIFLIPTPHSLGAATSGPPHRRHTMRVT